ncbi:MAG: YceK/YidQ family lipoprotein [Planctomycetes bacterium]|nr:YceK/YidQ family lipoprotein [Planctomycetota bacterium]
MASPRPRATTLIALVLTCALTLAPGCIIGSPVAAFSGEPYGMTIDDIDAIGGEKKPIWGGRPVLAAIDLPFAAVLDTAFLPIALLFWGISALVGGGSDPDHGHGHRHDDDEPDHTH